MAGIYVHIPFCRKKCSYCDFYSVVTTGKEDIYVEAIASELKLRKGELCGEPVRTIYIGGGTPSLLKSQNIGKIFKAIDDNLGCKRLEEFTIEVNPDDVTAEYVKELKAIGVNRISMGVQSFVDSELRSINRRHTAADAIDAVEVIGSCGISNISIDLIYGLPGQTLESWQFSMRQAVSLAVPHISCYNLSYEPGTQLYYMREKGKIKECSDDDCVAMFQVMLEILAKARYEHYEISNFALAGHYSRHNSSYWDGTPYLGLGAAAHSFDGCRIRSANVASVGGYIEKISSGQLACGREILSDEEIYNEFVMLGMRTRRGIAASELPGKFGQNLHRHFLEVISRYVASGLVEQSAGRYRLSRQGVMLADMVIRALMS